MSFDPVLDRAYEDGIVAALTTVKLEPVRIDKVHHNEKICDRIIAGIRECGVLIADFTGHRGGVYFEAGFAMGLGKPVVYTCREDELDKAHFDTRQYNHIPWREPADLRDQLVDRLQATIVPGLGKYPDA